MSGTKVYKKLAIVGDLGCGKTALVRTISEVKPVNTDVKSTVNIGKELTTVGIDYGRIHLDKCTALGVYGVPGQSRYSFIWDMVKPSIWGVVVLVKAGGNGSIKRLDQWLSHFEVTSRKLACVIGLTHIDRVDTNGVSMDIDQIEYCTSELGVDAPILPIDARNRDDAILLLTALNTMAGSTQ